MEDQALVFVRLGIITLQGQEHVGTVCLDTTKGKILLRHPVQPVLWVNLHPLEHTLRVLTVIHTGQLLRLP